MLVVTRFRIPEAEGEAFRADLIVVHDLLATFPGYESGHVGRNLDDPELWVLTTSWADVGSYRRALGSYDVKMQLPTLSRVIDEPSAYESAEPGADLNTRSTRSLS